MAGSLVSNYAIGDENIENVQLTLDKAYKGDGSITLTEMFTTTVPAIAGGSWADNNGALYKFDSNEGISITDPVTTATVADGSIWVCLVPSGSSITAAFTATAPTWSDSKQGWYGTGGQANYRYIASLEKSSTVYETKRKLQKSWADDYDKMYYLAYDGTVGYTGLTNAYPSLAVSSLQPDPAINMGFSGGNILIPVDGIYSFSTSVLVTGVSAGNLSLFLVRKNGVIIPTDYDCRAGKVSSTVYINGAWIFFLRKGDLIDFGSSSNNSGDSGNVLIGGFVTRVS